jgi:hypothetical protein
MMYMVFCLGCCHGGKLLSLACLDAKQGRKSYISVRYVCHEKALDFDNGYAGAYGDVLPGYNFV